MKIAIDAKWLYTGNVSGKTVVKNLLNALKKQKNSHKITILVKKTEFLKAKKEYNNKFEVLAVPFLLNNFLTNLIIIPYFIYKKKFDYVFYQSFGSFFFKSKSVIFIHDFIFLDFPIFFSLVERIYFFSMKYLANISRIVITNSNSERKRILKYLNKDKSKVKYIHLGGDHLSKIRAIKPNAKLKKNRYILYVGRLNIRKNIKTLINAFNKLEFKNLKLVIAGGISHKNLDNNFLTEKTNLAKKIIFFEKSTDNNIKWLYKNALLSCAPSFAEGFGLTPVEAMSQGCPVLISNISSHVEICGKAAVYFDPKNENELSDKLNFLINSSKSRIKMRFIGYKTIQKYTWDKFSLKLIKCIENID